MQSLPITLAPTRLIHRGQSHPHVRPNPRLVQLEVKRTVALHSEQGEHIGQLAGGSLPPSGGGRAVIVSILPKSDQA